MSFKVYRLRSISDPLNIIHLSGLVASLAETLTDRTSSYRLVRILMQGNHLNLIDQTNSQFFIRTSKAAAIAMTSILATFVLR